MPPSPQPQPQPKRQRWLDRDPDDADLDRLEDFGEDQHGISPSQWAYAASLIAAGSVLGGPCLRLDGGELRPALTKIAAHATGQGPMGVLVAAGASAGFAAAGRLGQRPDRPSQAWSDVTGTGAWLAVDECLSAPLPPFSRRNVPLSNGSRTGTGTGGVAPLAALMGRCAFGSGGSRRRGILWIASLGQRIGTTPIMSDPHSLYSHPLS